MKNIVRSQVTALSLLKEVVCPNKRLRPAKARVIAPLILTLLTTAATPWWFSVALSAQPVIAPTTPTRQQQAERLLQLGIGQHKRGQFQSALELLQEALAIYQELGDRSNVANSLKSLGDTYFSLGQYQQSLEFYQQSLLIRQALRDRQGEAEALDGLSNAYLYLGQEQRAKKFEDQAQAVRRELGNPRREAAFLSNLGVASESQGQNQQAIEFHQQQLKIAQETGDRFGEANALNNLAQAYESQGQYQQAIELRNQQLELAKNRGDRTGEVNSLNQLATAYESQGQYQQAIELRKQQLELARNTGDRTGEVNSLNQLATAYESQGQYPQAIELRTQQLGIAQKASDRLGEGKALNNLALTFLKSGNSTEAQKTLLDGIKVWEAIRATLGSNDNYVEEQATTYRLMQQVLIAQNQPEAALEMAEQGRVKGIVALLGMRLSSEPVGTGLKAAPPKITLPTTLALQEIAKAQKATLVEYSIISNQELYVWVIQPTGKITFRRVDFKSQNTIYPVSSLEDVVNSSLESIGVKRKSSTGAAELTNQVIQANPLLQLYQLLIKPIEDLLPQKDPTARVIFIPQKELFLVPFPALADIYGKSLIEKHTISIAPAIQVLALTQEQRRKVSGKKVVVVGNPTMPSIAPAVGESPQPLPPLVSAEQEALEIAQFLKTQALTGKQATKSAFLEQLPKARTIHLATYGLLNDNKQLGVPGAIAFAPSGNDNGILTAGEILNFYGQPKESPLRAELVVLSAGDTGRGKITGDGVIGLSLALISAGVPSIIMSLGSASDASTTYLMTEFYRQLKETGDKAQALHQAMLTTMKQYPNSRQWAAFTLIGETQ